MRNTTGAWHVGKQSDHPALPHLMPCNCALTWLRAFRAVGWYLQAKSERAELDSQQWKGHSEELEQARSWQMHTCQQHAVPAPWSAGVASVTTNAEHGRQHASACIH